MLEQRLGIWCDRVRARSEIGIGSAPWDGID